MNTLEQLIESIPEAPPGHERFRDGEYGRLEFHAFDGFWRALQNVLMTTFLRTRPERNAALPWLEDAANAAIVGFDILCMKEHHSCKNCFQPPLDYPRCPRGSWLNWIAAVKDALKEKATARKERDDA